jgi:hypothetical protein
LGPGKIDWQHEERMHGMPGAAKGIRQIPFVFTIRKKLRHIAVFAIFGTFCRYFNDTILYQDVDQYFRGTLSVGISIALPEKHGGRRKTWRSKISKKLRHWQSLDIPV